MTTLKLTITLLVGLICAAPVHGQMAMTSPILASGAVPVVTIQSVRQGRGSVWIKIKPFPGAADYRVIDVNDPTYTKYAGLIYATNSSAPSTEINVNGLDDGGVKTLIVQAIASVGQYPPGSLSTVQNAYAFTPNNVLGSNMGMTDDGLMSTNGQSLSPDITFDGKVYNPTLYPATAANPNSLNNPTWVYTRVANGYAPKVIGQSLPFNVSSSGQNLFPLLPGETQTFYDPFQPVISGVPVANFGSQTPLVYSDQTIGAFNYTIQGDELWQIGGWHLDGSASGTSIVDDHIMPRSFDGGDPVMDSNPPHTGHGYWDMSPTQSFNFKGGKCLVVSWEVDDTTGSRRWVEIDLAPATDPITDFAPQSNGAPNNSQSLFVQMQPTQVVSDLYTTTSPPTGHGQGGKATDLSITNNSNAIAYLPRAANGRGIDDRTVVSLALWSNTATSDAKMMVFEDGVPIISAWTPSPTNVIDLGKVDISTIASNCKVYFGQQIYHTAQEKADIAQYSPGFTYWAVVTPWYDQRHINNVGAAVEVAPTTPAQVTNALALPAPLAPNETLVNKTLSDATIQSIASYPGGKLAFTVTAGGQSVTVVTSNVAFVSSLIADYLGSLGATIGYAPGTPNAIVSAN